MKLYYLFIWILLCCTACTVDQLHENVTPLNCSLLAAFDINNNECTAPCQVQFNNTSDAEFISFVWDFGDGNTSTQRSPEHTYVDSGTYEVSLTATSEDCEKIARQTVRIEFNTFAIAIAQQDNDLALQVHAVSAANEDGYVIVGRRELRDFGQFGFWLKTDGNGKVLREENIGVVHGVSAETEIRDVLPINGEGYVMCGYLINTITEKKHLYVYSLSENGSYNWDYLHDIPGESYQFVPTEDGGFLIAGFVGEGRFGNPKGFVIKLNANGEKEWEETFNKGTADGVVADSPNSYGVLVNDTDANQLKLIRYQSDGTLLDQIVFPPFFSLEPLSLTYAADQYILSSVFITSVFTNSNIAAINKSGDLIWEKEYQDTFLASVKSTDNGSIIFSGNTRGSGDSDALLIKIDPNGNEEWQRQHGMEMFESGDAAVQLTDGGYLLAGIDYSISSTDAIPGEQGIYLVKTDDQGKVNN